MFQALAGGGGVMTAVVDNLVDIVWADKRPPPPNSDIIILDSKYAGSLINAHPLHTG